MAFPTVVATAPSSTSSNNATPTIDLPAGTGNLVIALGGKDGNGTVTWPSPWNELTDASFTGGMYTAAWAAVADLAGATTVVPTFTVAERSTFITALIDGWDGTTAPAISTVATGNSANPNPTTVTAPWGSDDNLFFLWFVADDSAAPFPVTAWPAEYADNRTENAGAASSVDTAIATRELAAASDDAGAATMTGSETWAAFGLVVKPAAAAGNVSVTPTTRALALATFAPTVTASDHKSVTPTTASLTLTTFAPTVAVAANQSVTPTTASLTLTTFAPTVSVSDNKSVTPSTKALSLTTFAPTVTATDHKSVTPSTASLTLTTFAPTVTTPSGQSVTPTTAALTLTGFAPTVTATAHVSATPAAVALSLTTFAPTVTVGAADVPGDADIDFLVTHMASLGLSPRHTVTLELIARHTASMTVSAREYDLNDTTDPTATFAVDGTNTDPTTVSLAVTTPAGTTTTYTYAGGTITKSGTGVYTKQVTLNERGIWRFVFTGTGSCAASVEGTVRVRA